MSLAMADREGLNRWQRMSFVSGHGEGWALYAERLMGELGYLDDPGAYLGLLDSQQLFTAQVALDIGVHLELDVPRGTGTGPFIQAGRADLATGQAGCQGAGRSSLQPQGLSRQGARPGRYGPRPVARGACPRLRACR